MDSLPSQPDSDFAADSDLQAESDATIISPRNLVAQIPESKTGTDEDSGTVSHPKLATRPAHSNGQRKMSAAAAAAQVLQGKSLDHYQLLKMIGGGGMGAVFSAKDTRLDRRNLSSLAVVFTGNKNLSINRVGIAPRFTAV